MKIRYVNYKKLYPQNKAKYPLFDFKRYWSGKLIYISFRHRSIIIDIRKNWVDDMISPSKTRKP